MLKGGDRRPDEPELLLQLKTSGSEKRNQIQYPRLKRNNASIVEGICEQSICQARASVMVYDDGSKKWVPIKPGQQGFSRINILPQHCQPTTFRVVGVQTTGTSRVVINYSIVKGLKYNQATPTFHQWRDARQVYGLNFASKEEATTFSNAMLFALNVYPLVFWRPGADSLTDLNNLCIYCMYVYGATQPVSQSPAFWKMEGLVKDELPCTRSPAAA
ncbi:unnamed protein product [Coregonus sp. 'balchen']|nr:unnamed protein product [Coregonus sp. 'balchen']